MTSTGMTDEYSLREALAVAVAATEFNRFVNRSGYLKENCSLYTAGDSPRFAGTLPEGYDYSYNGRLYMFANRDLVKGYFDCSPLINSFSKPEHETNKFPKLELTDEHYAEADKILMYYRRVLMGEVMQGTIVTVDKNGKENDMRLRLVEAIEYGKVPPFRLGLIAYIPVMYKGDLERDTIQRKQRAVINKSQYIGELGQRRSFELEIISNFKLGPTKSSLLNRYVYNAICDGVNLVTFYSIKTPKNFGKRCRVRGRVKSHDIGKYTEGCETRIDHVTVEKLHE